jgi:hypothetical protein
MFPVLLVYAGVVTSAVGFVGLLRPLSFLGLTTRWHGVWLLGMGALLAVVGWSLPAKAIRVSSARTELDRFMPVYQFQEFHSIRINASRDRVYAALKQLRANEIFLFRSLTWMRRFGRAGPESILNAPNSVPIVELATRTGFMPLAELPGEELVIGTAVVRPSGAVGPRTPAEFLAVAQPGFAVAAMNFRLENAAVNATTLNTETRVFATDAFAARRFARYWRTIYPGSAFIRRMWLRAVKKQAESPG